MGDKDLLNNRLIFRKVGCKFKIIIIIIIQIFLDDNVQWISAKTNFLKLIIIFL
jgi:hypothetical protein